MEAVPRILLVSARKDRRARWAALLAGVPGRLIEAESATVAVSLAAEGAQVAVVAQGSPLRELLATGVPVVVVAPAISLQEAIGALARGAAEYVDDAEIPPAVAYLLAAPGGSARGLRRDAPRGGVIGSRLVAEALRRVKTVARTPRTAVLISGERGTGKEIAARGVHALSARKGEPFVVVDCGGIRQDQFEKELFGLEPEAGVPGAAGRIEQAHRGTLLLREVSRLPLELQPKLTRVLQERKVWRAGAAAPRRSDVRIISTTHENLRPLVAAGRFREDLFYRLRAFSIELPPLREQGPEILHLADLFVRQFNRELGRRVRGLSAGAQAKLLVHDFPGNFRELRNLIEEAMVAMHGEEISADDLKIEARARESAPSTRSRGAPEKVESFRVSWGPGALEGAEREAIRRALVATNGNRTHAARLLGIQRQSLLRRLARLGIVKPALPRGRPPV